MKLKVQEKLSLRSWNKNTNLPEKELYKQNSNKPILNLAWYIVDEVEKKFKKNGFIGKIINIKEFLIK